MNTRNVAALFLLLAGPAASLPAAETGGFTVVVNDSRPSSLTRQQVADLFLRRASHWPDGSPVSPIDLTVNEPTRAVFSKAIFGRSPEGIVHHWQQQMSAGRGVPPLVKSEPDMLAFVKSTKGAIGYVAPSTLLPEGVKPVMLVEAAR